MLKFLRCQGVLPILALCVYFTYSAPFLGQWDSFDYLKGIVTHQLSALGIGRPVYLGYNILLWESLKRIFHLGPLRVEIVAMTATILFGVLGVVIFQRLAREILPYPADRMAALGFLLSPVYAIYAGFIMTEVPMLVTLLAAALVLWKPHNRHPAWSDIAGGILFGLAVGIREQALTMGGAFLWILYSRQRRSSSRLPSLFLFAIPAILVVLAPALIFYLHAPAEFLERTRTWLRAIPTGSVQFRNNAESSLLYVLILCPGAWFAVALAGVRRVFKKGTTNFAADSSATKPIPNPFFAIITCLAFPVAVLWRDADVQMHPRYVLIALPAAVILCASLFRRWLPFRRSPIAWAIIQILFFGVTLAAFQPFRQIQVQKMEFARIMRDSIPDEALIIAGNYSPILDYYRGIGVRPGWRILWSGWDWDARSAETAIGNSWAADIPVYLSTEPTGWSYFEREFLDLHFMLKDCRKESVVPNLFRVYPP